MQMTFAKWPFVALVGLAAVLAEGCKRHVATVASQPVVRSSPPVNTVPDFDDGPLPVESTGVAVVSNRRRAVSRPTEVQSAQVQLEDAGAISAAEQRRVDAKLLQEQQTASQRQQDELNREVEQNLERQRQDESVPRIQEAPEMPITQPEDPERIHDDPRPPAETTPGPPKTQ
jgi:hypothetical protein